MNTKNDFIYRQNGHYLTTPAYSIHVEDGKATYAHEQLTIDEQGTITGRKPGEGDTDLYVTSGMINCHLHWLMLGGTSMAELVELIENKPEEMLRHSLQNAEASLRAGITSGCDKGAPTYVTESIFKGMEEAQKKGALITKTQFSPYMLVVSNSFADKWCVKVESEEDLTWAEQQLEKMNAGIMKVIPETDYLPEAPHYRWVFSHDLFRKARQHALDKGLIFSVHSKSNAAIEEGINLSVDSIEHGLEITREQLLQMEKKKIWLGSTIEGFECRLNYFYEHGKGGEKATHEWDLSTNLVSMAAHLHEDRPFPYMLFATDAGSFNTPHASLRELYLLRKYGYTPEAVLEIATLNGAKFMRKADQIGSLHTRRTADMIYWSQNPLELPLEAWERLQDYIVAVVSDGKLVLS